jgi:3-phosphoshikimate 1-carboxyvinyltransferase
MSDRMLLRPAKNVSGSVKLPGDKSISHRYAMLAALAEGTSKFENFSAAADCASTLQCVRELGCEVTQEGSAVSVTGVGRKLRKPGGALDCGNSGSTMRMLSGILAAQDFDTELIGDESLSRRPVARIIKPLRMMGADIRGNESDRPPLHIRGARLRGIDLQMEVASAQVKTCVLFAGLLAEGNTRVVEPVRTRDHGELALRAFGATVTRTKNEVSISGGQKLQAIEAYVAGDISSAAFFLCAAMIFPEGNLIIDNVLLNPSRAVLLDVLTAMGGRVQFLRVEEHQGELVGTIQFTAGQFRGGTIEGAQSVALIDELPVLAAIAPYSTEGIEVHDARELRVKESDRIAAIVHNLRAMGAEVEELEDGLRVPGGQKPHGAELDSFGDHRIAMAFAVAALRASGESDMKGAESVAVSYPGFFDDLERIVER